MRFVDIPENAKAKHKSSLQNHRVVLDMPMIKSILFQTSKSCVCCVVFSPFQFWDSVQIVSAAKQMLVRE